MIIALCGQAGTGKTTCAGFVEKHAPKGYSVERFSFAASLKQAATLIFGPSFNDIDVDYRGIYARPPAFYGTQSAKAMPRYDALDGYSGRKLLQKLGTFCRGFNEDVFLNHLDRSPPGTIQVIDDLRYANEAARVQELGGVVVGLRVLDEPMKLGGHPSEAELAEKWEEMTAFEIVAARGRGGLTYLEHEIEGLLSTLPAAVAR